MAERNDTVVLLIESSSFGATDARRLRSITDPVAVDRVLEGAGSARAMAATPKTRPVPPPPDVLPDLPSGLIADAQDGNAAALTTLFEAHHPVLLWLLAVIQGLQEPTSPQPRGTVDDMATEIWLHVARTLGAYRGDESRFLRWFAEIATTRMIKNAGRIGAADRRRLGQQIWSCVDTFDLDRSLKRELQDAITAAADLPVPPTRPRHVIKDDHVVPSADTTTSLAAADSSSPVPVPFNSPLRRVPVRARSITASITLVRALGPLEVLHGDQPVAGGDMNRERVRTLLSLLVHYRTIDRADLCEALWPDLEPRAATGNLLVATSFLRRLLAPWRRSSDPLDPIRINGKRITLVTGGNLVIDADLFRDHLVRAARAGRIDALNHYLAAVDLYRGPAHQDVIGTNWADFDRAHYRDLWLTAAVQAAELLVVLGDITQAAHVLNRVHGLDDTAPSNLFFAWTPAGDDAQAPALLHRAPPVPGRGDIAATDDHPHLVKPTEGHDLLRAAALPTPTATPVIVEALTARELSVLAHLSRPLSNREIAEELYLSLNTVKTHLKGIYRKLGVERRDEAIRRAREMGLI